MASTQAGEKGMNGLNMEQPGEKLIPHYIHPRSVIKDFAYTIIISTVIAAFLTVTGITTKSLADKPSASRARRPHKSSLRTFRQ